MHGDWKKRPVRTVTNLDLLASPSVHAQRLDLGYVGAQFPVQARASNAEEDAQLDVTFPLARCFIEWKGVRGG